MTRRHLAAYIPERPLAPALISSRSLGQETPHPLH